MKNLNLWDVTVKDLKINCDDDFLMCYGHDEGNVGELYVCSHNLVVKCFHEDGDETWSRELSEVASPDNKPVDVTFLSLPNTVCVGLANGELFTIGECGTSCDLAGVCDNGLLAMEWSPDQELLVLVTREMSTILMSCTFDPITETNLLAEEFGEKQFITVGWGKKETQFHGREGKQAAKAKTEVSGDPQADDTVKITWRGDGELYAVGFTIEGIRRFKVFDREGHLQYTSEKQPGLETNLSWRPSGNVIATTQKLPDKYIVSFFEKNGLKHGGFDIPVNSTTTVEDLLWSSDSEIITLQCKDMADNTQKLLLFTMSNYHWYLKQTLVFNTEQNIRKILWDNDFDVANNKKLHIVLSNGCHYSYTWIWNVDHSKGKTDDDDAVVTVIDGRKLLVTGFRQTVVPPPMAALEIELESFANSVHFAPTSNESTNTFFVITADQKLVIYEQTQKFPLQYKALDTIILDKYEFPFQNYNWHWLKHDTIICVTVDNEGYHIVEYNFKANKLVKKNVESLPAQVLRIESHPTDSSKVYLQLNNGDILLYTVGGEIEPQDVSFEAPCPRFNVVSVEGELHLIGLSHKGNLYIDNMMIMNNVSSFYVHTDFLVLTTLQHVLLCTELTNAGLNAIKEYSKNETAHVYKRKIERGGKLIVVVPNDTRTVFQMPRGNLEAIQPRPLSLKIIGKYLSSLKYYEAFDLMRKQRINLNLIYDHDPKKFINSIKVFLEAIKNNSWLSLFLSDLENVDVTKTMYSSNYADEQNKANDNCENKVQRVCELVRSNLSMRSDTDHRILPFLTSFVKTNTVEDLESALSLIKDLKMREEGGAKLPVGSDEALKYLLYMVDVNKLFDVALGMYDFDLVLLVANKSQKDPKEFIPMLNELNEMEQNYKRFSINKHLKRFDKAVQCLVECGPERYAELKAFVKYHSLYREALNLFTPDQEVYKQISEDFGLYLRLKKQFTDAGIVYERGGNVDKAIECYKDALEWELAVNLAQMWPKDQFKQLCWDLINSLKDEKRHREALSILEQFYDDKDEAIRYAIESGQYKTAIRICTQYKKDELKEDKLKPGLLEEYKNLQELVENNWCMFIRHRDRLKLVRENKIKNPVEMYDTFANRDCDLYSDAGSTLASSSRGSSRSYRSSKNRRKHERKVASLKEGSQYEDVALVMALHTLVTSSFELRAQVRDVNVALSYFGQDKQAFVLQTSLEKLLKEMKDSFRDIWTSELVLEATNASIAAQNVPEGGPAVIPQGLASLEPHIRIAPVVQDISWKLEGLY
uniref:Elongator complex protein 1 n=1 Tax=Pectinophora gossypiella TaxID=13191 RepID=A0A1E1VXL1_PECGO